MDCRCIVWRIVDNSFIHANDTSMILLWHFFVNKKEKYHWGNVQEVKWLGAGGDSRMRLWYFFVQKMFRVNGIKGVSTDAFWHKQGCLLSACSLITYRQKTRYLLFIFWFQTKTKINPCMLLRALRLDSCRTGRPYESKLSTVNLYDRNRWRPQSPPRKSIQAINQDKPQVLWYNNIFSMPTRIVLLLSYY